MENYILGMDQIHIVKNNCYAETMGASLVGGHNQKRISLLKYDSFTFNPKLTQAWG